MRGPDLVRDGLREDPELLLALASARLGAEALDGGAGALGDVTDEGELVGPPVPHLPVVQEEHGHDPPVLHDRHVDQGADADVQEGTRVARGPRVEGHVRNDDLAAFLQARAHLAVVVEAVAPGDARHARRRPVPLDLDALQGFVDRAVACPVKAQRAGHDLCPDGRHLGRSAAALEAVAEGDQGIPEGFLPAALGQITGDGAVAGDGAVRVADREDRVVNRDGGAGREVAERKVAFPEAALARRRERLLQHRRPVAGLEEVRHVVTAGFLQAREAHEPAPRLVQELGLAAEAGETDEVARLLDEGRQTARARLGGSGLGDVTDRPDEAHRPPVPEDGVAPRGQHALHAVVPADDAVLDVEALGRADGGLDGAVGPLAVVRVNPRKEGAFVGDRVVVGEPEQGAGARVPGQHAGDEVVVVDAGAGPLQREPEPVLRLLQVGLRGLALRDVGDHDEDAVDGPVHGPARDVADLRLAACAVAVGHQPVEGDVLAGERPRHEGQSRLVDGLTDDLAHPPIEDLAGRAPKPGLVVAVHEPVDIIPVDEGDQHRQRVGDDLELVPDTACLALARRRLGAVAQDLEEAQAGALGRPEGHQFAARPEAGAVLAQVPALVVGPPGLRGAPHFRLRPAGHAVLGREEGRGRLPDHFPCRPAQDAFGTRVPGRDPAIPVRGDDGEVDGAAEYRRVVSCRRRGAVVPKPRHLRLQLALASPQPLDLGPAHGRTPTHAKHGTRRSGSRERRGLARQDAERENADVIKPGNRRQRQGWNRLPK